MSVELAKLRNGCLALLTDEDLPGKIGSIEYFRRHRYLQISYEKSALGPQLIEEELPDSSIAGVESALDSILIVHIKGNKPEGYYVPLSYID